MISSIHLKKYRHFLFFVVAGVLGYIVDVSVTIGFSTMYNPYVSRIPAFIAAATATWLFNRSITFRDRQSKYQSILHEYLHYLTLMLGGLITNYFAYAFAMSFLHDRPFAIPLAIAIGALCGLCINYLTSKKFIFSQKA